MKSPTKHEKIVQYENFLHSINIFCISGNIEGIRELLYNADKWSYAHRCGEFFTDKQRKEMINNAFWKLCDTPEADKLTEERQKAYTEAQKQKEKTLK